MVTSLFVNYIIALAGGLRGHTVAILQLLTLYLQQSMATIVATDPARREATG